MSHLDNYSGEFVEGVSIIMYPRLAGVSVGEHMTSQAEIVQDYMLRYGEDITHISSYLIDLFRLDSSKSDKKIDELVDALDSAKNIFIKQSHRRGDNNGNSNKGKN